MKCKYCGLSLTQNDEISGMLVSADTGSDFCVDSFDGYHFEIPSD